MSPQALIGYVGLYPRQDFSVVLQRDQRARVLECERNGIGIPKETSLSQL